LNASADQSSRLKWRVPFIFEDERLVDIKGRPEFKAG
jgi:hypothetical protein